MNECPSCQFYRDVHKILVDRAVRDDLEIVSLKRRLAFEEEWNKKFRMLNHMWIVIGSINLFLWGFRLYCDWMR